MEDTDIKMTSDLKLKSCSMCLIENRDVYLLEGQKKTDMQSMLIEFFPLHHKQITQICRNCWYKLESFHKFKRFVEVNLKKRMPKPSSESLPKKRKPVVEGLIESLKKSKLAPIETDISQIGRGNSAASEKPVFTPVDHTCSSSAVLGIERPFFTLVDHTYSENTKSDHVKVRNVGGHLEMKKAIIQETAAAICTLSSSKISVLSTQSVEHITQGHIFREALDELSVNVPFLFELLQNLIGNTGNKDATIALIYGMILNSRNRRVSSLQKLLTTLAVRCHADNKLLSRLNKLHITVSAESKVDIINAFSEFSESKLVHTLATGVDGKLNGDNVDIYVTTNDIRMKNKNKDYHVFATDWTPFRVTQKDFEENESLKQLLKKAPTTDVKMDLFQPDLMKYRQNLKFLVARILINHLKHLKWMDVIVPKHLPNPLQQITERKTMSYCLPILLKNEAKYEDCISIMDSYEDVMADWYQKAGRAKDFESVLIPVGGDQLTRVRLDGAKTLRLGAHTAKERFDNLFPVIVEMFHMQMDFLEKTLHKFLKKSTGRDSGTLGHLKILVQRTSVNGNVKSRFKAHEEFTLLCGTAYVLEAAMEYFGMDDTSSQPTKHQPPDNVNKLHKTRRQAVFDTTMDSFLDKLIDPLCIDDLPEETSVELIVSGQRMTVPVRNEHVLLRLEFHGQTYVVNIPFKKLKESDKIQIPIAAVTVDVRMMKEEELHNYVRNFLQYFFIMLNLKDSIAEGDIFRLNNMLKLMIPFFYHHSTLSKYMVECIDYVLKTEFSVEPELALQVRLASFVNPTGKIGKNKAADMQKENQVKELKELIRGLGSNKTENSVVKISKAYPVIKDAVYSLDNQIGYNEIKFNHKHRSEEEDLEVLNQSLRKLRPFKPEPGRMLQGYQGIKPSIFYILHPVRSLYESNVINTAHRLKRGLNVHVHDVNDEDVE